MFTVGQLVLGYIKFFERLTEMMECIGIHLSYLSEYSKPTFQESQKLQKVCCGSSMIPIHINYSRIIY